MPKNATAKPARLLVLACTALTCAALFFALDLAGAEDKPKQAPTPQPVDDSMHHFMEYVFEPNYKRLKASMAAEPNDKSDWKAIKGDALTLAEGANLLLLRTPEENATAWQRLSVAVRKHGGELYQAARKSDYTAARTAYNTMLQRCNTCHEHFADGKYQLKP